MRHLLVVTAVTGLLLPPISTSNAVTEAARAILSGAYPRAVAVLDPEVRRTPHDLELRGLFALAEYLEGQRFQAERQVLILRRLDPPGKDTAYLVSRHFLSVFHAESPVTAPLIDLLARGGADGFLWLGQTYQERALYVDAVTILTKGVSRYPNSAPLLDGLGFNAWKAGLRKTSITAYQDAVALQPRAWGLYYNLGWVYFTNGMYTSAAASWKAALALSPSHPTLPTLIHAAEERIHP